jgi:hypothetical protein
VILSVDEIAREKSVFGTKLLGEESEGEPMLSTVAGYSEGAIEGYVISRLLFLVEIERR